MKKPAIPSTWMLDAVSASVLGPIKENIEIMTGIRGGMLLSLGNDADLAAVISKLNAIIERINAHTP